LEVLIHTFEEAEPERLFQAENEVVEMLEMAKRVDPADELRTSERLMFVLNNGLWSSTPGEPAPRHVALRDAAAEAASRCAQNRIAKDFFMACSDFIQDRIESMLEHDAELLG